MILCFRPWWIYQKAAKLLSTVFKTISFINIFCFINKTVSKTHFWCILSWVIFWKNLWYLNIFLWLPFVYLFLFINTVVLIFPHFFCFIYFYFWGRINKCLEKCLLKVDNARRYFQEDFQFMLAFTFFKHNRIYQCIFNWISI